MTDTSHADAKDDHKHAAVRFLQLVVEGQIIEAYQKYVNFGGKHHNPFFPAGFPALQEAMKEDHVKFSIKRLTVINALGDGDLAAVHSYIVLRPGGEDLAVVHIFRFRGDKIVELWDCGQSIPADSPNADGAF